jgi:hypothetical protein
MKDLYHLKGNQRSLANHTDNRKTLATIANPSNHQNLVELIREEIRRLEYDNLIIHFTWVKTHDKNEVYSDAEGHWQIPGEIYTHNGATRNRNKLRGSWS